MLLQEMERKARKHVHLPQHKNTASLSKYNRLVGYEEHFVGFEEH